MDGLALLCNLHADGPLSLRRLRRAGLRTLDLLVEAGPSSLTTILRASPSQVRRFRNEAVLLRERLRDAVLEAETGRAVPGSEPVPDPGRSTVITARHPQAFDLGEEGASASTAITTDRPAEKEDGLTAAAAPLRSGEIEGLDARSCERLVREGVRTYRSLVDLASLSLARRAQIKYTRLLDLGFHARAFLAGPPEPRVPAASSASTERVVELQPAAPAPGPDVERPPSQGSYRGLRVFEGARLEPSSDRAREEPGVAGPFV